MPDAGWRAELRTTFQLHHRVAGEVRAAIAGGRAPFVISGNCNMTVAVTAGLGAGGRTGVVWLDAHGDLNTPETDASGFLDGQGLAMLTGRCWTTHTASLEGFAPVPDHRVLLAGARDLDDPEHVLLSRSQITWLKVSEAQDPELAALALGVFCRDIDRVHMHLDADVLDPGIAPANDYAAPGGMAVADVQMLIERVSRLRPVVSVTIASWDPGLDQHSRLSQALLAIADTLAGALVPASSPDTSL